MTDKMKREYWDLVSQLVVTYRSLLSKEMNGPWLNSDPFVQGIRAVGEALNRQGGCEAMASAVVEIYQRTGERYSTGPHFNTLWDGIGAWRA